MPVQIPVATRKYSDYILHPNLTETAAQAAMPTKSYGNFGLSLPFNLRCPGLLTWPGHRVMIFGFLSQNLKTQAVAVAFSIAWAGGEVEPLAEDDGQARDRLAAF